MRSLEFSERRALISRSRRTTIASCSFSILLIISSQESLGALALVPPTLGRPSDVDASVVESECERLDLGVYSTVYVCGCDIGGYEINICVCG